MTEPSTWYPIDCEHGYDHCPYCDRHHPIPALEHGPGAIDMLAEATGRLNRIAQAHTKHVDRHGGTWGECNECGHSWPCPTYVWATTARDPSATWDPADDEEVNRG